MCLQCTRGVQSGMHTGYKIARWRVTLHASPPPTISPHDVTLWSLGCVQKGGNLLALSFLWFGPLPPLYPFVIAWVHSKGFGSPLLLCILCIFVSCISEHTYHGGLVESLARAPSLDKLPHCVLLCTGLTHTKPLS